MRKPLIFNRLPWVPARETSSSSNVLLYQALKNKNTQKKKNLLTVVWKV
jgi:hypothetical protein